MLTLTHDGACARGDDIVPKRGVCDVLEVHDKHADLAFFVSYRGRHLAAQKVGP